MCIHPEHLFALIVHFSTGDVASINRTRVLGSRAWVLDVCRPTSVGGGGESGHSRFMVEMRISFSLFELNWLRNVLTIILNPLPIS